MADYYIDVANEKDEVVGKELKSKKIEKGFISRVIAILIRDAEGKFLMCRRADHKDDAAGLWDMAVCGTVECGEKYGETAKRELKEELGISCGLESLGKYYLEFEATKGGILKVFCTVFLGYSDEEPELNHELSEFRKMSFDEIEAELAATPEKFCQGFRIDFQNVREKLIREIKTTDSK
ncbi:MAG: NUDIX hydrolase [Parcubacteria group bacterium]|jgi:isopentenyl-diphosphate delta-isomerase